MCVKPLNSAWPVSAPDSPEVLFLLLLFLFFGRTEGLWGILVPQPGIEPMLPAVEARSPNHWTTREVPPKVLFFLTPQKPPEKSPKGGETTRPDPLKEQVSRAGEGLWQEEQLGLWPFEEGTRKGLWLVGGQGPENPGCQTGSVALNACCSVPQDRIQGEPPPAPAQHTHTREQKGLGCFLSAGCCQEGKEIMP